MCSEHLNVTLCTWTNQLCSQPCRRGSRERLISQSNLTGWCNSASKLGRMGNLAISCAEFSSRLHDWLLLAFPDYGNVFQSAFLHLPMVTTASSIPRGERPSVIHCTVHTIRR
jgi:hypothetical protein